MSFDTTQSQRAKTGYYAQQLASGIALTTNPSSPQDYKVQSDTDAIGFLVKFIVTAVHGTGTYAGTASVLSALNEIIVKDRNKKYIHDFKSPAQFIDIAFMFDDYYGHGGKFVADTAIAADGTFTFTRRLWAKANNADFPLTFTFVFAPLTNIYSTVGTGTATITIIITPIKGPHVGAVETDTSTTFTFTGLTATNNDVSQQTIDRARVTQLAMVFGTEGDFTDVTLITPEVEIQSLPLAEIKDFDEDTLSGHQTALERLIFYEEITLAKDRTLWKVNESVGDSPTLLVIGH